MTLDELESVEQFMKNLDEKHKTITYYQLLEVINREIKLKTMNPVTGEIESPNKPQNVKCPECGGDMVSRLNRQQNTRFWGCKNYPQCKGTRDSMGLSKADKEAMKNNTGPKDHEDVGPDNNYRWIK